MVIGSSSMSQLLVCASAYLAFCFTTYDMIFMTSTVDSFTDGRYDTLSSSTFSARQFDFALGIQIQFSLKLVSWLREPASSLFAWDYYCSAIAMNRTDGANIGCLIIFSHLWAKMSERWRFLKRFQIEYCAILPMFSHRPREIMTWTLPLPQWLKYFLGLKVVQGHCLLDDPNSYRAGPSNQF